MPTSCAWKVLAQPACPPQPLGSGLRDIHRDGPTSAAITWKRGLRGSPVSAFPQEAGGSRCGDQAGPPAGPWEAWLAGQRLGNRLMLSPSRNSGAWPGPCPRDGGGRRVCCRELPGADAVRGHARCPTCRLF